MEQWRPGGSQKVGRGGNATGQWERIGFGRFKAVWVHSSPLSL